MKKAEQNQKYSQLKLDFSTGNSPKNSFSNGKVININNYSRKAFASFIVKNSKSF